MPYSVYSTEAIATTMDIMSTRCEHYPSSAVLIWLYHSGIRAGDVWLVRFSSVRPVARVLGVASCRVNGGRDAEQ